MTADEFITWAMQQPEGCHYELVGREAVRMAPERVAHVRIKGQVYARLSDAIRAAGLSCEAFVDGLSVRVDADTVYRPDAFVRSGEALDDNATEVTDPLIVVEVVSPSSQKLDSGMKLADYFRIPSVRHYLIVRTDTLTVIHHRRDEAGAITTSVIRSGPVRLDPPGLEFTLAP